MRGLRSLRRRLRSALRRSRSTGGLPTTFQRHAGSAVSLHGGTRLDGGSPKHSAFTGTKEHGTLRQATATQAASSFSLRRGGVSVDEAVRRARPHVSSYTGLGWSTFVTVPRGGSGAPRGRVV